MNAIVTVSAKPEAAAAKADKAKASKARAAAAKVKAADIAKAIEGKAGLAAVGEAAREYAGAKGQADGAGARMVVALTAPGVLDTPFHFSHTVKGAKGKVAAKQTLREFATALATGNADKGAKATAFKGEVLTTLGFNDVKSAAAEAAYRYLQQDALPAAIAVVSAGCTAKADGGKVVVGGGPTRGAKAPAAKATREAGSIRQLKALGQAALGKQTGGKGKGSKTPDTKGKVATLADLLREAARLLKVAADKGPAIGDAAKGSLAEILKIAPAVMA